MNRTKGHCDDVSLSLFVANKINLARSRYPGKIPCTFWRVWLRSMPCGFSSEEIAAIQWFLYEVRMRDGIYEVEFSDLGTGLKSKGIAIIDCFRFDAVIEGKVFWADYTQNWEVLSATLFSSRYRNELARRRIRRDWLYTTIISQIEDGFEITGEVDGDMSGKISMRGRWIAGSPSREREPNTSDPPDFDQSPSSTGLPA